MILREWVNKRLLLSLLSKFTYKENNNFAQNRLCATTDKKNEFLENFFYARLGFQIFMQ